MSVTKQAEPRALGSYPVSLQHAAAAIWGEGFWGRERINPESVRTSVLSGASDRSRSSA
jgi:hypothetical protein